MKKALVRKIEVHETGNVSNYEVCLPATASADGKRIRKRFKRRADAVHEANQLNIKLETDNIAPLQNEIHHIAARYQDKLTPAQFEEALADKAQLIGMATITLSELGNEFIKAQEDLQKLGAVGDLYITDINCRIPKLVGWLGNPEARAITKEMVDDFVKARLNAENNAGKKASPRTVKNYVDTLSAVLNYGIKQDYLYKNVTLDVKLAKYKAPVHICKPEELESLLEHGCHHVQAWIMFGAFGGLRSSETHLMKWENVRLDENQFFIGGTKNENAERFVELTAPLKAYCKAMLEGSKPAKGLVFGGLSDGQRQKLMELAYKKADCRIKRNALRRSFGSYHLVAFEKPENTATEMGHASPTQTFKAYRKAVLKSQAQEFWKIRAKAKAWVKGKPKSKSTTKTKATSSVVAEIIPAEKLLAA